MEASPRPHYKAQGSKRSGTAELRGTGVSGVVMGNEIDSMVCAAPVVSTEEDDTVRTKKGSFNNETMKKLKKLSMSESDLFTPKHSPASTLKAKGKKGRHFDAITMSFAGG